MSDTNVRWARRILRRNSRAAGGSLAASGVLVALSLACGTSGSTQEEAWDGGRPAEGVPYFFGGECAGHVCTLDRADIVFEDFEGDWPAVFSAAIVGDLDGDNYDDIAIGDPLEDLNGIDAGIAYVFYGRDDFAGHIPVSRADGSFVRDGWQLRLGASVAGPLRDVRRGNADFLVGAPSWQGAEMPAQGLVLGLGYPMGRLPGRRDLSHESSDGWFSYVDGMSVGSAGSSLAVAGDVDGDGNADFLVGAPFWGERDEIGRSGVHLVYWSPSPYGYDAFSAPSLDEAAVLIHGSAANANLGRYEAGIGDYDGDTYGDFVLGGLTSYLVYGGPERLSGRVATDDLEAGTLPAAMLVGCGPEVASVGDYDGDTYGDFVVAEHFAGPVVARLVFGRPERLSGVADVSALGVSIAADATRSSALGGVLAGIGDVDGDGYDDFALGDPLDGTAGAEAGAVHLFLGRGVRPSGDLALDDADVTLRGPADDDPCTAHAGWLVAGRGDVNWDGRDDFLVGSSGPGRCGKIYLVLGADR